MPPKIVTHPIVSALIVNWNTCDLLRSCLKSLVEAEPSGYVEWIVVDNGSVDGSVDMAREFVPHDHLVANEQNLGFTAATNQAFRRASAPYVLMLNSDTIVRHGAIKTCVDYMEAHPGVAAIGCRLVNPDGTHQSSIFRFPSLRGILMAASFLPRVFPNSPVVNWDRYGNGDVREPTAVDVVMGSFLLIDRRFLADGPVLDERFFMYGEETELCRRLCEAGGRVVFLPETAIVHVHKASSKGPEQVAWSELATRRGVLRYLRMWRSRGVAEVANAILLVGLGPRYVAWSLADVFDAVRARPPARRRLRASAAKFHLKALVRPSLMDEPWGPPPCVVP